MRPPSYYDKLPQVLPGIIPSLIARRGGAGSLAPATTRVLLVEDSSADARPAWQMLAAARGERLEITHVERLGQALERMAREDFDVVLLDLFLPDADGLVALDAVKAAAPGAPIVVMSGLDDQALALAAVRAGAQDYLIKGKADGSVLARVLRYAVERKRLQARLASAETLRALREMTAGTAHHLNNLLTVILLQIALVLEKGQAAVLRRALEVVERAGKEAAEVVRRLDRFSRPQLGSPAAPTDLNQLARDVLELTRPRWHDAAQRRGIRMQAALEPGEIPPVPGAPADLKEVLMHLFLNAVEALPAGGRIRVTTWADDGWVHCAVADTGVGMAEAVRRRALEPFFSTKGPKSTGLGLSASYGIVRAHGGELLIQSAEGQGTTVTFRLPVGPGAGAGGGAGRAPGVRRDGAGGICLTGSGLWR